MDQQSTPPTPPPTPAPPSSGGPHKGINVIERAKNILITPKNEWYAVDKEVGNVGIILTTYVLPLLGIGALTSFIGQGLIGQSLGPFGGSTANIKAGLIAALLFVVFTVITLFIVAATIDALAQTFGSEKNWGKSFQLAAYSLTALYIGSFFLIFPALGILVIICSLYCIYQLYTGIPIMKKTTVDKQVAYLALIILVTIVCLILLGIVESKIIEAINRPRLGLPGIL